MPDARRALATTRRAAVGAVLPDSEVEAIGVHRKRKNLLRQTGRSGGYLLATQFLPASFSTRSRPAPSRVHVVAPQTRSTWPRKEGTIQLSNYAGSFAARSCHDGCPLVVQFTVPFGKPVR